MKKRYGDYLTRLKDESYRDHEFAYVEKEDTPRPLLFQLDLLRQVGCARSKSCTRTSVLQHSALSRARINMPKPQPSKDIDGYIAQFPADVRTILEKVRATIRRAAPDATEKISYQMPAFKQHGILVYFAAWTKHIGLYPPMSGDKTLEKAIARYAGPKGNLQFPLDEPIPFDLIERIVKLRVKQDLAKAAAKRKKEISDLKQAKGIKMKIEIIDEPIRFHLHGIGGVVENERLR